MEECVELCICGHTPHGKNRFVDCGKFEGRGRCVPKCSICDHPGKRVEHSKVGCSVCIAASGPSCQETDEPIRENELAVNVNEASDDEEDESDIALGSLASGQDEMEMLLVDQVEILHGD